MNRPIGTGAAAPRARKHAESRRHRVIAAGALALTLSALQAGPGVPLPRGAPGEADARLSADSPAVALETGHVVITTEAPSHEVEDSSCLMLWLEYYRCVVTNPASDCTRPVCRSVEDALGGALAQQVLLLESGRVPATPANARPTP